MSIHLIVIKTFHLESLKEQYKLLGLHFNFHKHGKGPYHYACEYEGLVFEIYPLTSSPPKKEHTIRLGFKVQDLKAKMPLIKVSNWKVISDVKMTEWGERAIIQDLDGRTIEISQASK